MKVNSSTSSIKCEKEISLSNKKKFGIVSISGMILFFLMLTFPRTYQLTKVPFLVIVLLSIIFGVLLSGKIKVRREVLNWFLTYIGYGAIWGSIGLINNKEYATDFLRLNVGWVIIFLLLVSSISKEKYIEELQKVMIWATLVVSIYNINYYLYGIGARHIAFLTTLDAGQMLGIHLGYTQLTAHNIGSLIFLIPFVFSGILINKDKNFAGYSTKFTIFVLLVSIFAAFLSGRRMLWIILGLMAIIYYFAIIISKSGRIRNKQLIKLIIFVGIVLLSIQIIFFIKSGWDYQSFLDRLTFSGDQGEGVLYRAYTAKDMIAEVYKSNLFFGTGGGNPAFEMTFIQIFNETGVVGISVFIGLFLWAFTKIIILIRNKKGKKEQGIPLLVGSICFFISMWSNPYFSSFDFMWTLFLPIAYINTYLNNEEYEVDF